MWRSIGQYCIPTTFRVTRQPNVKWQLLFYLKKHWFGISIGIGSTICIYQYYDKKLNTLCRGEELRSGSQSCVARNKKCFQEDILSFLREVSFLRHNRELQTLDKINVLCLLGPSARKEDILPYLLDSNGILCMDLIQGGVERVIGETTCILFLSISELPEALKREKLAQIKYLLRGLATWNCAAMDAIIAGQRYPLLHRLLLHFRHRLSETAHAVLIYSPQDTADIIIQRTIQVAMKEGIPLLVLSKSCSSLFESRLEDLCLKMKRYLMQRFAFEHPAVRYLHPFTIGQNWITLLFQLIMGIYYWWKARSIGYKDGFEDGAREWNYRLIGLDMGCLSNRDDELWEFCYGSNFVLNGYCYDSASMNGLLQSLNSLSFLGMNEIALYKRYVRLLLVDGSSSLVGTLFDMNSSHDPYDQNPYGMRYNSHPVETNSIPEKPSNQLYFLDGNVSIWTLPWTQVTKSISIRNFLHHAALDWGSLGKSFLWQLYMNWLDTTIHSSILASRWKHSLYQDILISSYYDRQNVSRFLNGIDGVILPVRFSKDESPMKYGRQIIEQCLKQQIPVFFVDCCNKEHSCEISNGLRKAIRRTLIQRALKIQQQRYISARTQFFLWLYTWRYDMAYMEGYRQAWMLRLSSHQTFETPSYDGI
ncbi:hypothetical protein GpartN1_g6434.t1 [Galdieria partita]|uniref:Uncharacterized protein n=1 Tax=Galdieria partita TaxID=83374 RepID=A0A9C7Q1A1_9RHOD|nr:hypothetical protein GpartN1_g6434.t1 [Galdieria partita]